MIFNQFYMHTRLNWYRSAAMNTKVGNECEATQIILWYHEYSSHRESAYGLCIPSKIQPLGEVPMRDVRVSRIMGLVQYPVPTFYLSSLYYTIWRKKYHFWAAITSYFVARMSWVCARAFNSHDAFATQVHINLRSKSSPYCY